jgi:hypothetical protein
MRTVIVWTMSFDNTGVNPALDVADETFSGRNKAAAELVSRVSSGAQACNPATGARI